MSFAETALLGGLAGFTIYLGLTVGRLQLLGSRARVALAMFSVGILVFLLVDVLSHGFEIAEDAVTAYKDDTGSLGHAIALALLLIGGFTLGSAGLGILERRLRPSAPAQPPIAGGAIDVATADQELLAQGDAARDRALQTSLIIGFALHNATEGFGIVGPLGDVRPSWRWIALVGLIGGGPTFIGSMIGYNVTSDPLELVFYAVAGGAILYVIGEIWHGMRRYGHRELGFLLLSAGFAAGVLTDFVVAYGGG